MSSYGYNYGTSTAAAAGGLVAGLAIFVIVLCTFCLAFVVMSIIGQWKIFSKANKPGWASLIPIYNQYILCQVTGVNPMWLIVVYAASIISSFLGPLAFIGVVVSIYFNVLISVSLARSFGKDDAYAIGLIFLGPIFYLILGCGDSKYLGAKPMDDVVFNVIQNASKNSNNNQNNDNKNSNAKVSYCSSCGTKIDEYTRFCPNCGKEID